MPFPSAQPERPWPEFARQSDAVGVFAPDGTVLPPEPEVLHAPWVPWLCILTSTALGVAALVGWATDNATLRAIEPNLMPMMPWTALGHVLAGVSVASLLGARTRTGALVGRNLAVVLAGLGAVLLVQFVTGWDAGIDRLLFPNATRSFGIPDPGRVSVGSAAGFFLTGVSIVMASGTVRRRIVASQILALVVFALALFVLLGYALGVRRYYEIGPDNPASLPSTIAFLPLSVAILFARPRVGPVAVVLGADPGGFVARRALFVALLTPLAFGWLRWLAERAGILDTELGLALLIVALAVFIAAIGWLSAYDLHVIDMRRRRVEAELRYSEERLRATLEALPVGVWFTDETGRVIYGNSAGRRIWGGLRYITLEELHEFRAWSPSTGEPLEPGDWALSRALSSREPYIDQVIEVEALDGSRKILRNSAVPIIDAKGRLHGAVVLNEDITERRRADEEREAARLAAEKRAREAAALHRATAAVAAAYTVEAVTATIARTALEATDADSALTERIDRGASEVEITASAGRETVRIGPRLPYRGSLAERVVLAGHAIGIRVTGDDSGVPKFIADRYPGSAILAVPMIEAGDAIGALILIRSAERPDFEPEAVERATTFAQLGSIAFRKAQLLEDSEARRRELEQVLERQSWLVRGFTHDVKNPLGAADGHLALVEGGIFDDAPDRQRSSISSARRSIHTAISLIDALAEFARAETGQIEVRRVPTDVRSVARELVEEFRATAETKGLGIELSTRDGVSELSTDPDRVRQILGNLLSNAIKYTEHGTVRIDVTTGRGGPRPGARRWVAVGVTDSGPGIPRERQDEVFREFTRLRPGGAPGAGLGLAISRRIARMLGGDVTVSSEMGHGSTFTLWLPVDEPAGTRRADDATGDGAHPGH